MNSELKMKFFSKPFDLNDYKERSKKNHFFKTRSVSVNIIITIIY